MKVQNDIKLDFTDVLLRPKRSTLSSRSQVNLERTFTFPHSKQTWTGVPILAANMDTIGTLDMWKVFSRNKLLCCLYKHIPAQKIIDVIKSGEADVSYMALSTGITDRDFLALQKSMQLFTKNKIKIQFICIDVANGYMQKFIEFCQKVRSTYPAVTTIAGNVVTREICEELIINGKVDIIKVGIGSGSVCTTRLQTGVGMPQFSATLECSDACHGVDGFMISDGGICVPGDICKAFGAGADFVMCGSMFAGHDESSGEIVTERDGKKYKVFYGMSSSSAMIKYHGGVAKYRSAEGKTVKVPYKGPVQNQIENMLGGLRSACTYTGAFKLKHLPKCATFMRVHNQVNNYYGAKLKVATAQDYGDKLKKTQSQRKRKFSGEMLMMKYPSIQEKSMIHLLNSMNTEEGTVQVNKQVVEKKKTISAQVEKINSKIEKLIDSIIVKLENLNQNQKSSNKINDQASEVLESFYIALDASDSHEDLQEQLSFIDKELPTFEKKLAKSAFGLMMNLKRGKMLLKQKLNLMAEQNSMNITDYICFSPAKTGTKRKTSVKLNLSAKVKKKMKKSKDNK